MDNINYHYSRIRRILILTLALNWTVAIAKIIYGVISRCASMTADGFHSLSDGTSNIIGLIGIHFACQPKDSDHPYGHKKYETFFSLGIAALLFLVCFNLFKEGVKRLFNPVIPQVDLNSFIIMLITMAINFWVMRYEYNKGVMLKSDILTLDSMHTKADIFTSLSVIIALVAIKLKLAYRVIDPAVTIMISLFIAKSAYEVAKHSSAILCDSAAILDVKKIVDIVLGVRGVNTCHKIRTRGRPDDIHVDLHVQVNPDMHIDNAHKISSAIEEAIKSRIPCVTDVVVHMEPKEK
ncbi:MAG: cation transporter [Candidatus Omnitrophica bacterium]|nr:cation transporter [Candidatus Omnitrophota bacterium]